MVFDHHTHPVQAAEKEDKEVKHKVYQHCYQPSNCCTSDKPSRMSCSHEKSLGTMMSWTICAWSMFGMQAGILNLKQRVLICGFYNTKK